MNNMPSTHFTVKEETIVVGFITSGALAVRVQKKPSPALLTCTIRMNVNSLILATLGLFLVVLEVTLFLAQGERVEWPHCRDVAGRESSQVGKASTSPRYPPCVMFTHKRSFLVYMWRTEPW
ncbi:putative uncharacterized protein encoded by LINC00301 isoform X2 [Fukomys damarensis]|uniref:putative uncharacterized protein encoded by LINC00301 isoform X2 n=1 Tax=Fukomys damarensis TaxID=885580 RepID=UPI00053F7781|nr:putative uncharacterized protein encoded by LINC00301 isoform X2 [Fukomys damarensis]